MATVMAPESSPANHPPPSVPKSPTQTSMSLPPLITSTSARPNHPRMPSYARNRLSTFSNTSNSQIRSRPQSSVFPFFLSSLSYTLVRDFAYPSFHPLHYGPQQETASHASTPASESHKRLSDPSLNWDSRTSQFARNSGADDTSGGDEEQLPQTSFGDGPPWSEDEDLQSPIVTSASSKKQHKKQRSNVVGFDKARGRTREYVGGPHGQYTGTNGDGSQTYYVSDMNEAANGPGGEFITYPADGPDGVTLTQEFQHAQNQNNTAAYGAHPGGRKVSTDFYGPNENDADHVYDIDDPHQRSSYPTAISSSSSSVPQSHSYWYPTDESRYSKDYQFTIASPDEEMHGKAVALFDFARENENELPLVEGQVILVSYRHGQGWLVAQDPKTGESGLVPEEYVRLLRDIEGGWRGLMMNGAPGGSAGVANSSGGGGGGSGVGMHSDSLRASPDIHANIDDASKFSPEAKTPTQMEPHPLSSSAMFAAGTNASTSNSSFASASAPAVGAGTGASSSGVDNSKQDYYVPVVSHFSTTSEDLRPYPGPTHSPTEAPPAVRRPSADAQRRGSGDRQRERRGS